MSYKLVSEVLDQAPSDLGTAERLLLLVIAHHADEQTRRCWPGVDLLEEETGLKPDSLRRVFGKLAQRGLEVRVPMGKSSDGRPIYAFPHRQTVCELPVFAERPPAKERVSRKRRDKRHAKSASEGGTNVTPNEEMAGRTSREWRDVHPRMAGQTSRPKGQEPSKESSSDARSSPMQTESRAKALDILADYAGERAPEALALVEDRYRKTHDGETLTMPDRFLAKFSPEQLAHVANLLPSKPDPAAAERRASIAACQHCDHNGIRIVEASDGADTATRCHHQDNK